MGGKEGPPSTKKKICKCLNCVSVLGFELRASHLLGRCSTT
jgi:hypothetical protein